MTASLISLVFNAAALYGTRAVLGERFGVGAIALITALSAGVNMGVNLLFACRRGMISPRASDWLDIGKSVLSALAMGAAVRFLYGRAGSMGLGRLTGFCLSVLAGAAVYAVCALLLRSGEMTGLCAAVREKLHKQNVPKKSETDKDAPEGGPSHD